MIHREGRASLVLAAIVAIGLIVLSELYWPDWAWLGLVLGLGFFLVILQFFRNPPRPVRQVDDRLLLAPADGKIVVIETCEEPEYFKDKRLMVSIFMSPINVHVNRVPLSGKVAFYKYHPGKYLTAWHPKASTENERTSIVIERGAKAVLLRQIAGALARRICVYVEAGQSVRQGEELGFIKFGSRVDLFLPLDAKIKVGLNDKVSGNRTVIAELD